MKRVHFAPLAMLLLLSVPHYAAAGPVYVGSVPDNLGDTFGVVSGPDILFAGISIDDSWVTFTMQFAAGTWDAATTKTVFTLDADQDSATGSLWNGLGVELQVAQGYLGDTGTAYLTPFAGGFTAGSSAVHFLANGVEYSFARSLFGAEDGALDFIASVQVALAPNVAAPINDFAPNIERGAGPASTTRVPEPSTFAMLAGGLSLLSAYRRRGSSRIPRE